MKETLRTLFQQNFNPIEYRKVVLQNLLHAQQLLSQPQFLEETNDGDCIYGLGYLTDADGKQIGLYYTDVVSGDVRRKRVGFRQMMKKYTDFGVDAAIAVFADKEHWRLSYMSDLKGGETSAKRFSYILGDPNGQYNTPVNRLLQLGTQVPRLRLKDIFEAFSVETLSDEFFDLYRDHYADIVEYLTGKRMVKVDSKWVEKVIHAPLQSVYEQLTGVADADKIVRDYVKKMMGRIVFLHFLQKKEWLNGNTNFMQHTFSRNKDCQDDFLEKILEPLFFGFLNTRKEDRAKLFDKHLNWDKSLLSVWENIPYLNGGLFEQDELDNLNIRLPRSMFDELFKFLADYNFTVDENDPDDAEVGVDPEMLGKIFESLLEDNKAKGAFYTPKEIVRYMCKESLIAYLSSRISESPCPAGRDLVDLINSSDSVGNDNRISSTAEGGNNLQDSQDFARSASRSIRKFVETHEMQPELEPYRDALDTALRNVKICDPAIGSGAFPMGLLNELWRCREALYSPSPMGRDLVNLEESNHAVGGINQQDQRDFVSAASRSKLKKEIIENNIYGVDIEKGAIDIARLRFWLSIVVDAEEPEPLPNFDYKFMQGNSLIESYKGIDLSRISNRLRGGQSKSTQLLLGLDSDFSKKNLQRLMRDYFSVTDHKQKASMRQAINDEVKRLITDFIGGSAADLDKLDPSANQDFFLWHTWFKDIFNNGGFDIVIGNPPYGAYLSAEEKEYYRILYPETQFKIDTYSLFVLLSLNIMNSIGTTYFIIPNTLLDNYYEEKVREKILKYNTLIEICDLSDNIFQSAVVHSMIIGYSKRQNDVDIRIKTENVKNEPMMIPAHYFLRQPQICISYRNYAYQNLFDKLEKNSVHLQDVLDIRQTIKTGNDKIYICTERKADNFMPILRGKDICRYGYQYPGLYVNYGKHLANPIRHDIFEQPKILIREAGAKIVAAYDDKNYYIMSSLYNAILKDNYFNLKYLLSLINSRLFQFIMNKLTFEKTKGAFTKARIFHYYLLPVKKVPIEIQNQFITLVNNAMEKKEKDFSANIDDIEKEIDNMVYQLYDLSTEEIAVIEQ